MTLHRLVALIRRYPLVLAAAVIAGVALALVYTSRQPTTYQATAKLFVSTTTHDTTGSDLVNSGLYASNQVSSYAAVATTPAVLDKVITSLDLDTTPGTLASDITASVPLNTVIVQIDARADTAQGAADVANAVATSLPQVIATLTKPSADVDAPTQLSVIQSATPPSAAISPQPKLNLLVGLVLGVTAGLALIIVLNALRRRVASVVEIEDATGLPVIAVLPRSDDAADGALRVAWASMLAAAGHAPRSMLIVALSESTDVPKLGGRLAGVMAETGRTVVWIDADLLGGRTSSAFGVPTVPGLADTLAGTSDLDDIVQPWNDSSLSVIPSGSRTTDLGQAFSGVAMATVLDTLKASFETVVLDATGVPHVAELALLGQYVGGVVLVATPSSKRELLASASRELGAAGLRLLGVVVDEVPERDRADFERRFLSDDDLVYET
ncbi:MAG: Wzz/FepE/Etk N-terminal domain-containing protein [Nocardioides sp.]|uniref:Wzz/FepE/Etk N-terminal domain-containing protein n=1 Tax=Nocardioides sp. TaxID=35761 RepID=UPI0039E29B9E